MDKQQYHDKALSLLNDKSTYAVLNSDPTSKTQRKLNKMLLDLKKAGRISDSTYKMLYSSDGLCPRFYGLPKIHKPGIPLRPIVSFVNSPTDAISGYLARILSPVFGNTDYNVKNSCEFADFISDKTLNACEELVSFDVVSLFTKKSQLMLPLRSRRRDSEKMPPYDKELLCLWRILFICCLFASKPRNLHIMAPTINKFLVQRWVRLSLLSLLTW